MGIRVHPTIGRVLVVYLVALILGATPRPSAAGEPQVEVIWGVQIAIRDGSRLNATVYRPLEMEEALPVIFTMTPYTSDTYHERGWYFAQHGYVFVLVDVRGRGNSEGDFEPFSQEAEDGYDVVEWLAGQPWCNGRVGMWGGSYAGYNQWAVAKEFPPHLATIVPAAAAFAGVDFPFWKNIPYPYDIQWQTLTSGLATQWNLFSEQEYWKQVYSRYYNEHLPFTELPRLAGNQTTEFLEWASHPHPDAYWDAMSPTNQDFAAFEIPILSITGHYDGDQPGAMEYYKRHMRFGSEEGKARHYLIVGPWDHAGTRTPRAEVGGLTFGDASLLDLNDLHRQWYDWTLKDSDKPEFLKDRIAYFVVGANGWKYVDSLETIASERKRLYLSSAAGMANDAFQSGSLVSQPPGAGSEPDSYVYDPLDTRPGELEMTADPTSLIDQRYALHLFGNGLVYHSRPFEEATEISGYLKLEAWLAIDVPDTDFQVDVYEILVDGSCARLTQDLMRARFRRSLREPELVTPGEVNRYIFDGFYFFSRRVAEGSRLRLVFRSPNSILLQKNYNSGGVVAQESAADARTARVTLYHDTEHPSFLELPVVR
jgi:putative CocE/NonD family hydrolase